LFSKRAIITQLPEVLDFHHSAPVPNLFYAGPFRDEYSEQRVAFPWERINGKPLIYASMGTIRNRLPWVFEIIAEACASSDVQLVISLGGGLSVGDLGSLSGSPMVVDYAPQIALLKRSVVTINCAGLNTTLDAIMSGIPLIAIPVAEDQPGVATRIANSGVGVVIPVRRLTVRRLQDALKEVLQNPAYRESARRLRSQLQNVNGVEVAGRIIERVLGI
jgi:zeaxanthin glucosyltransferase